MCIKRIPSIKSDPLPKQIQETEEQCFSCGDSKYRPSTATWAVSPSLCISEKKLNAIIKDNLGFFPASQTTAGCKTSAGLSGRTPPYKTVQVDVPKEKEGWEVQASFNPGASTSPAVCGGRGGRQHTGRGGAERREERRSSVDVHV